MKDSWRTNIIANEVWVIGGQKTIKITVIISYLFIFFAFKSASLFFKLLSQISFTLFACILDIRPII